MELTAQALIDAYDLVFPPMYYAWHERVKPGTALQVPASFTGPEFFIFHSKAEAKAVAREAKCRLIHIRDYKRPVTPGNGDSHE